MSDLPSRERIAEAVTFAHITDSDGDLLQDIGSAYAEGRLVDRETFDWEAANEEATRWAAYLAGEIPYPFGSNPASEAIVDAAIGDTDE